MRTLHGWEGVGCLVGTGLKSALFSISLLFSNT